MSLQDRYLAKAARVYHSQLEVALRESNANPVVSYLSSHGLPYPHPQTERVIREYQLGLVTEAVNENDQRFTGMMAIPYLSPNGPKAIRFRNMRDTGSKIAQRTGQAARLYNTNACLVADDFIGIAEGEIDALVATERMRVPTVGIPGVETWVSNRAVWSTIFKNFTHVYVFTDGDKINEQTGNRPGEELGKAIQEDLGFRAKIIASPEGEDVSSMVASGRMQELLDKLKERDSDDE